MPNKDISWNHFSGSSESFIPKNWNFNRFMVIPDMLKNAPMFKRLDARIKVSVFYINELVLSPYWAYNF